MRESRAALILLAASVGAVLIFGAFTLLTQLGWGATAITTWTGWFRVISTRCGRPKNGIPLSAQGNAGDAWRTIELS